MCSLESRLVRQGAVDGAEGIADLGTENTHDSDYNDGDEREDDRVLDEALAFFFGCKQHDGNSFLNKWFSYPRTTLGTVLIVSKFKNNSRGALFQSAYSLVRGRTTTTYKKPRLATRLFVPKRGINWEWNC